MLERTQQLLLESATRAKIIKFTKRKPANLAGFLYGYKKRKAAGSRTEAAGSHLIAAGSLPADLSLTWMIRKATLPKGLRATRPRVDPKSDPAAGSDKAASESGMFADGSGRFADESGRFAPSGLVAGLDDPKSDPAEGSDKAAG